MFSYRERRNQNRDLLESVGEFCFDTAFVMEGVYMSKIAFIFPGQGAQYPGMGKDFYENIPVCREVFKEADEAVGFSVKELCFTENEQLNITEYTQIAMLTVEVALLKALEEKGIRADVTAGLSLGEYGALVAAGVLSTKDAFKVIRQRGILMQNAVPNGGAMAAVLGLDGEKIKDICDHSEGTVSVANYNCPGQIVITGEEKAVESACEALKAAGAKRTVRLKVSGPFHSALLQETGEKLLEVLDQVEIRDIKIPYLTNVTADYVKDKKEVKDFLKKQIYSPVKWQQSIERMIADGVDTFIEIGPGKTLSGFMKKIDRTVKTLNIDKLEDLDKAVEALKEV